MCQQLQRRPAIWIVTLLQNLAHNRFRRSVLAFGNSFFGQFHSAFAKTFHRFLARSSRQKTYRRAKLFVRDCIILFLHRDLARGQGFLPVRRGRLAPSHFSGFDVLNGLREACHTKDR